MGHTVEVDRLLIRTAAGQAGIGNNDGRITCSAPASSGASPIKGSHRHHRHQPLPIPMTGSYRLTARYRSTARDLTAGPSHYRPSLRCPAVRQPESCARSSIEEAGSDTTTRGGGVP